jgi:hypothetical protein
VQFIVGDSNVFTNFATSQSAPEVSSLPSTSAPAMARAASIMGKLTFVAGSQSITSAPISPTAGSLGISTFQTIISSAEKVEEE